MDVDPKNDPISDILLDDLGISPYTPTKNNEDTWLSPLQQKIIHVYFKLLFYACGLGVHINFLDESSIGKLKNKIMHFYQTKKVIHGDKAAYLGLIDMEFLNSYHSSKTKKHKKKRQSKESSLFSSNIKMCFFGLLMSEFFTTAYGVGNFIEWGADESPVTPIFNLLKALRTGKAKDLILSFINPHSHCSWNSAFITGSIDEPTHYEGIKLQDRINQPLLSSATDEEIAKINADKSLWRTAGSVFGLSYFGNEPVKGFIVGTKINIANPAIGKNSFKEGVIEIQNFLFSQRGINHKLLKSQGKPTELADFGTISASFVRKGHAMSLFLTPGNGLLLVNGDALWAGGGKLAYYYKAPEPNMITPQNSILEESFRKELLRQMPQPAIIGLTIDSNTDQISSYLAYDVQDFTVNQAKALGFCPKGVCKNQEFEDTIGIYSLGYQPFTNPSDPVSLIDYKGINQVNADKKLPDGLFYGDAYEAMKFKDDKERGNFEMLTQKGKQNTGEFLLKRKNFVVPKTLQIQRAKLPSALPRPAGRQPGLDINERSPEFLLSAFRKDMHNKEFSMSFDNRKLLADWDKARGVLAAPSPSKPSKPAHGPSKPAQQLRQPVNKNSDNQPFELPEEWSEMDVNMESSCQKKQPDSKLQWIFDVAKEIWIDPLMDKEGREELLLGLGLSLVGAKLGMGNTRAIGNGSRSSQQLMIGPPELSQGPPLPPPTSYSSYKPTNFAPPHVKKPLPLSLVMNFLNAIAGPRKESEAQKRVSQLFGGKIKTRRTRKNKQRT